uniref:Protein phosphatase 1 regulatory subunit pprA n=1 Tax=Anthurium amnicola TaxID=1678845 RepID=A0A1D1XZV1_9ARAE
MSGGLTYGGCGKKVVQHCTQKNYAQDMHKDSSKNSALNAICCSTTPVLKEDSIIPSNNSEHITNTSASECCGKSEELNMISYSADENEILRGSSLKKSQSLGSELDRGGIFHSDVPMDDEIDPGLPLNNIQDEQFGGMVRSFDNSCTAEVCGCEDLGINLRNQNQSNLFEIDTGSIFSESISLNEDIKQLDNYLCECHGEELPSAGGVEAGNVTALRTFSRSCSLPRLGFYESSLASTTMWHRSRSVGNLCDSEVKTGIFYLQGGSYFRVSVHQYSEAPSCHDMSHASDMFAKRLHSETDFGDSVPSSTSNKCKETIDKERDLMTDKENHDFHHKFNHKSTSNNFITSVSDCRESDMDRIINGNIEEEESFTEPWHELDNEDFNIKRMKEWIRQIDIHDDSVVQEVGECSNAVPVMKKDSHLISGANTSKTDVKGSGAVKAAYNYISSLTPASTSAYLGNLGLVVIPFLSAFPSLRVLNLSGNSIVRITYGSLPRGLHMLNLSRNNISIIEGLRELTRLRVLDLSYNRIFRIGHGLAACSSLKELYLAGNKISEVEGLHRLLKLNVLDLTFNKISTVKSLGQLAANYGSLQAINLEGNPAQRNVGDDQLQKYLRGVCPRLIYFNKHIIRTNSGKELSERLARSATSHQFDNGVRSDHRRSRRGHHTTSSHKVVSSSNKLRVNQAVGSLAKLSKHRDQHVPIPALKASKLPRASSTLFSNLQTINPIRRSQSEGSL